MSQKKLLVIAHSYSTFVKDQIEALSPSFEEIFVFVRLNYIAELSNFLPINRLKPFTKSARIDLFNKPSNIRVIPIPLLYFPFNCSYKKLGERHYRAIDQIIQKEKITFDLIHAHFTWSAGYVGAKLKEFYKVPFVLTAHGYDIYSLPFKDAIWKKKIEYVLNSADAIITVSHRNFECIRKLDVNAPVHVIPNGFSRDLFSLRDTLECRRLLGLPRDRKILLTVGSLEPVKGQKYLIDSVIDIRKERNDILCIIVGMGMEKRALEKQIQSLGLEDHVILIGWKPHNEIPFWINACDVFVLPSLNEGNPMVMFETIGCGKPFVGTMVGGVPEVITCDDYGLLVEPADSENLAEKILLALDREWNREQILAYAERYRWENIEKEIMSIYNQVLL
jgi:glycosyltransferase involved in cell wall biosynthesis